MVKGITRQVYVVQSPDRKLFEQAIFILKADAPTVTDDLLLKEARRAMHLPPRQRIGSALWAGAGAGAVALAWLLTALL